MERKDFCPATCIWNKSNTIVIATTCMVTISAPAVAKAKPDSEAVISKMTYDEAFRRGMAFRLSESWKECLPYMLRAQQLRPLDCDATNRIAECHLNLNDLAAAEKDIAILEAHCQEKSAAHFLHFLLYWLQKRPEDAFRYALKVKQLGPAARAHVDSWFRDGQYRECVRCAVHDYNLKREPEKALRLARLLCQLSPSYNNDAILADFLIELQRFSEARAVLPSPMTIATSKETLGEKLGRLNRSSWARDPRTAQALSQLARQYPNNALLINSQLELARRLDDASILVAAWPGFVSLAKSNPGDGHLALSALRWLWAGHKRQALKQLSAAFLTAIPEGPLACRVRATLYQTKGMPDRALAEFKKALMSEPKNQFIYMERGILYSRLFMGDRALADFNKAIELAPKEAYCYQLRGDCYQNLLIEPEKARADFAQFWKLTTEEQKGRERGK